jgi:hypothetical protein
LSAAVQDTALEEWIQHARGDNPDHAIPQPDLIIRFQRVSVGAGIGWAVLTVATGETGPTVDRSRDADHRVAGSLDVRLAVPTHVRMTTEIQLSDWSALTAERQQFGVTLRSPPARTTFAVRSVGHTLWSAKTGS